MNDIPKHILRREPMTVGELKKAICKLSDDTPIYLVVDKISEDAWDKKKEQWRYIVPLIYTTREEIRGDNEDEDKLILLLEYESL